MDGLGYYLGCRKEASLPYLQLSTATFCNFLRKKQASITIANLTCMILILEEKCYHEQPMGAL
jgi:hypothetical protein